MIKSYLKSNHQLKLLRLFHRSFSSCPTALFSNKKLQKSYTLGLSECLLHSDVTVRDASSEALGVLVRLFGELFLMKLLPGKGLNIQK